jgi:hypothetical protein
MYLYENVIREHELRVAKSLERYRKKKGEAGGNAENYPLFATARREIREK